jgi:hypothetical protein
VRSPTASGARGRGCSAGAAQHGLDPRQKDVEVERLGDVIVGAELEPEHLVELAAARGEEDYWGGEVRLELA